MEQKLIKTLLEQYKERGIDLYALLDEPLFEQLSLEQKVKLIKQYASHIASGTSRVLTPKDIKVIIKDALITAAVSTALAGSGAYVARNIFSNVSYTAPPALAAIGIGTAASTINTVLNIRKIKNQRAAIRKSLDEVVARPTDENALRTLILRNRQTRPNRNLVTSPSSAELLAKGTLGGIPGNILANLPEFAKNHTLSHNEFINNPWIDPHSEEHGAILDEAHRHLSLENLLKPR